MTRKGGEKMLFIRYLFALIGLMAAIAFLAVFTGNADQRPVEESSCFYLRSLHYTANGMAHWYSKENGGLELLTGIPYSELGCKNCHAAGCDRCHKTETVEGDCKALGYSTRTASKPDMCLNCHGREKAMIGIDYKAKQEDVHLAQGMVCTDCHSAREMHGDGTEYVSMKQPGAMATRCENCHDTLKPTEAHTAHGKKLDCKACHVRHVVSCTNCHFDTLVEKGVRKAIPVSGWVFLMNFQGKVTSASMQTFVTKGDKTFLMFAPHMSHSIMKEGRGCDVCHASEISKEAQRGMLKLTWLENGKVSNLKGVIPVVDRVDYRCVYQNFKDGQWLPIENPDKPLRQYVAFGQPLSKEQLEALAKKQAAPAPKME
jgi:hypothetical protein